MRVLFWRQLPPEEYRYSDRQAEHRGRVLHVGARERQWCHRKHEGHHELQLGARRALRVRLRQEERPEKGHNGPQGEHHEVVGRALLGDLTTRRQKLPRHRPQRHDHRQLLHAARFESASVRRCADDQSLRRHRVECRVRPLGWRWSSGWQELRRSLHDLRARNSQHRHQHRREERSESHSDAERRGRYATSSR